MGMGRREAMPTAEAEQLRGTTRRASTDDAAVDERQLLQALCAGDEAAFVALVRRHHSMLTSMAQLYVPGHAADALIHDVWGALLHRLDDVDAGVSLRVTLLQILLDQACSHIPRTAHSG